jgi:hypothetical protein
MKQEVAKFVLGQYLRESERAKIHARDLEILNRPADILNAEAEDSLEYPADPLRDEINDGLTEAIPRC